MHERLALNCVKTVEELPRRGIVLTEGGTNDEYKGCKGSRGVNHSITTTSRCALSSRVRDTANQPVLLFTPPACQFDPFITRMVSGCI